MRICLIKNWQKNCRNQILENLREEKYIHFYRQYLGCWSYWYAINKQIWWRNLFLLCVIDAFSKYACVIPLKDKKGITITNAFQKS